MDMFMIRHQNHDAREDDNIFSSSGTYVILFPIIIVFPLLLGAHLLLTG